MTDAPKRPRAYDVKDGKVILYADQIAIDPSQVRNQRVGDMTEDRLRTIIREEITAAVPAAPEVRIQVDNRLSLSELIRRASQHALHSPRRR